MTDRRHGKGAGRVGIHAHRASTFITRMEDVEGRPGQMDVRSPNTLDMQLPGDEPLGEAPAPLMVTSKMIAFFGPKGGTGTTTVALNVGGTLARMNRSAVVVDMDFQLGAVPVCLDLVLQRSLSEIMDEAVEAGEGPVTSGLDRHQTGLSVVAQGDRLEDLATVTTDRLPRFFDALGHGFQFVIVDGLRDFNDHAVVAMDLAHTVVMVVTQDVPAIRAAARSLRVFRRLGYGNDRLRIVLNRYDRRAPVTLEAIQNALGQPVHAVLRNDFPLVEQALNHGVMVSDVRPNATLAGDLDVLARSLADMPIEAGRRRGLFGRLFKR